MVGTNEKSYKERDIRNVIYESGDVLMEVWAPQLRSTPCYWQIGTSKVNRVKINALCPEACIQTDLATQIEGTSSEYFEKVKTKGVMRIDIFDKYPILVHVTRSRNVAPFMADGILGSDFLKKSGWDFDKRNARLYPSRLSYVPTLPGSFYIPHYAAKLRDRLDKAEQCRNHGNWSAISQRLHRLKDHLSAEVIKDDRNEIVDVLEDYADCLYLPLVDKLGTSKHFQYPIKNVPDKPIYVTQPKYPHEYWDEIEKIASDLLRQGVIKNSTSPYNFAVYLQDKKSISEGQVDRRLIVDYGKLNSISEVEKYPIPTVSHVPGQLHGSKYFSVLDLASAGYQIELRPEDREKTAFTTRSGRYEFQRMPVQIKNGSQYMQRLTDKLFEHMKECVFVCHDDILVYTRTIEEHEVKIRQVLNILRNEGLKLRTGKCQLFRNQVKYLGHLFAEDCWYPNPELIEKMTYRNLPTELDELRNFLGLGNTFSRFIPDFAGRAKPIWDIITSKESHFTTEAINAFKILQKVIKDGLVLYYPDSTRSFTVKTGVSEFGIFAILQQAGMKENTKSQRAITCASRTYKKSEAKYFYSDKKSLALEYGMDTFSDYNPKPSNFD